MKTFNSTMMLPLVASLALGMGLSTQASALEQNKDFTIKPDAYPTTADCYVHTPKGCPIHVGYDAQGWYPDVHGRHTNAKNDVNACFDRAADYDDWCGGDEATQALFVSNTGEVTLDSAADAESFSGGQTVYLKSHHGTYFYMADGDFKVGTKSVSSKMELVRVSGSGPIKFGDKIALKSVDGSGVYVTALHAGEQHNAVARATKLQGWETFTIVDRNGNTPNLVVTAETAFALKGAHGLHIAGTPDGKAVASVPHIDDWEMVRLEAAPSAASFNSGQTVYLKSHHGTYFYMADGDFKVGTKRASSKMELVRVGGSGPIKFGDQIALKSVDGSGVYVTALHAGEQHNAVARATKLQGWETFTIVDRNGNTPNVVVTTDTAFALKGAHGLHIAGTPDGKAVASVPHIDDWEMVRLEEVPVDDGVAQTTEDEPAGYFYIPAQSCTQDIGSVDASLGQRGALSACEIRAEVTQSGNAAVWTLTLPGSTMIERIDFSDAAHLKDAVLTIEDPELPEGKQVIYTSEPLNPDGAASFSVTDEMYDASSTEYSWLVFGGVIRIHTNGAGIEGAVVKVIQGDVSQLSLNPTTAQAALVHDLATANHNLEQAEQEASREIPVPVETNLSVDLMTAGPTWTDTNGQVMATYSLPPRSTVPAGYAHGPWKTREANAQYGLHIGAAKSGNENGEFYWVKELNAPNGIEIDIEYNGEKVLPLSFAKGSTVWGTEFSSRGAIDGLVTAPSSQVDSLKLGYKHNRVLWKLFHEEDVLGQGSEVYLQGICGRNYASEGNGYDEWAPGGNNKAKNLFCTSNDDGGILSNNNNSGAQFGSPSNYSMDGNGGLGNFRENNAWIFHPIAGTTSVDANGEGSMQFKLQSKADPSIFLGLGTLETISANGGSLQGVSFVSQLSVSDSPYQSATVDSAATFTMRWSGGETRTGPIDAELNAFAGELAEMRTHFNTIERNLSNAQQTIERMKDMKDLISSTHENIKSARELTTAVKKVPMVRYVAVPFDRGLKLIEKPFSRMDSALPGKERLDQLNTLLTEIDTYLQNGKPALRVLATESEKLNAKRTNAYRPNTLPEHNGLNGCGQAMELLPSFVFQGLADAMGELNDGIDNTGSFESPPADCDEACQARVVVQNAASAVVLLANNLDRINAALEDARKYVRTINSFSKHIKAAGDKVNAGGWMTKTVEFIEDIPVIGWFVKTVRRAVEKYVVDPVMDQAMSLADGLIQPLIADAGLSPETSINDFIQVYNKAMAAKAEFNEAKKKANAKTVAINKMKKMGSAGATQAWESAKGKAYDTIVDKIQEECDLD